MTGFDNVSRRPSEELAVEIGAEPAAIDHASAFIYWLMGLADNPGGPPSGCRPLDRDQLERVWDGLWDGFRTVLWDAYEAEL